MVSAGNVRGAHAVGESHAALPLFLPKNTDITRHLPGALSSRLWGGFYDEGGPSLEPQPHPLSGNDTVELLE